LRVHRRWDHSSQREREHSKNEGLQKTLTHGAFLYCRD
jgi:hypothetical protein